MIGLVKPSKLDRQENKEANSNRHKKVKVRIIEHFICIARSSIDGQNKLRICIKCLHVLKLLE